MHRGKRMNICYIACALDCKIDFTPDKSDYVIGADKGYLNLINNGIEPNVVIGDFDSYTDKIECENIIKYPVKKDFTDSALAAQHAISKGYDKIIVYGAIGGHLDHTLANIALLADLTKKGINIYCIDSLEYNRENTLVILAVTDKYKTELVIKAREMGFENILQMNGEWLINE